MSNPTSKFEHSRLNIVLIKVTSTRRVVTLPSSSNDNWQSESDIIWELCNERIYLKIQKQNKYRFCILHTSLFYSFYFNLHEYIMRKIHNPKDQLGVA